MSKKAPGLLENIIEKSINEIYVFNTDNLKFFYVNKKGLTNLGYKLEELEKMTPVDLIPEFTEKSFRDKISPLQSGASDNLQFNTYIKRENDSTYPVKVSLEYIDEDNQGVFVAYMLDITEIEKANSIRKKREAQISRMHSDLESLIDSLGFGVVIINMKKKIININNYAVKLIGYESEEILKGKHCCDVFCPSSEDDCPIIDKGSQIDQSEKTLVKKNGEIIPVIKEARVIEFNNEKVILESFIDISNIKIVETEIEEHRRKLEKTIEIRTKSLEKQQDHLEKSQKALSFLLEDMDEARENLLIANQYMRAANEELESFSYSVSHDLRSPLTRLDGFSKALLDLYSDKLDEKGQHYLKRIRASSQHMAALINDLLTLSRITRAEINEQQINLSEISNKIIDEIKETNKNRNVEFLVEEKLMAFGDKTLIKSLLENLISNAFKFTKNNDKAQIEIGKIIHNSTENFFIKDNGVGFDMKYYDKLFAVFQRLHSNEEFSGTGIGLASVNRIVSKHNGQIFAESKVGKGTTFYFTLNQILKKKDI